MLTEPAHQGGRCQAERLDGVTQDRASRDDGAPAGVKLGNEPGREADALDLVEAPVSPPARAKVTIDVRAAGVNPAGWEHIARGGFGGREPVGYEVSGGIAAFGPDTAVASGGTGDELIAFRVNGRYASTLTVSAADVSAKPPALHHPAAANLLLTGTTAAEMLRMP